MSDAPVRIPPSLADLAVEIHPGAEALGESLAARILAGIRAAGQSGRLYLLGCPGGRTPVTTYRALARQAAAARQGLRHVVIVMMDNYVLPDPRGGYADCPDDAHYSCRRFAIEQIWQPLNAGLPERDQIPRDQVWLPDPRDPGAYEARLEAAGGIDLFILASGASDGHVAFNPPGSRADSAARIIPLAPTTRRDNLATFPEFAGELEAVPAHGVSVGLGTLVRHSREAVLVLHGEDKREALRRLAACAAFDPAWPASIIHRCRQPRLLLDRAVAEALRLGEGVSL